VSAPQITDKAFAALRRRFQSSSGISLSADKKALVEARLRARVVAKAHGSFDAYCELLEHHDDGTEHQTVVDLLTTNETYFFREPRHFATLALEVKTRFAHCNLRVWSAACSTGEEPYSLAMTLLDQRPLLPWEIHASDISTRVLEQARRGVFPMQRLEHMPPGYLERFCLRGRGRYAGNLRVSEEVRHRVRFYPHNLLGHARASARFEVVFLRNVLIYFEPARKLELLENVLSSLVPGGLLFVGHAEPLHALPLPLQRVTDAVFEKVR
jgi:chemotaxis protein methyltransferase CheR